MTDLLIDWDSKVTPWKPWIHQSAIVYAVGVTDTADPYIDYFSIEPVSLSGSCNIAKTLNYLSTYNSYFVQLGHVGVREKLRPEKFFPASQFLYIKKLI